MSGHQHPLTEVSEVSESLLRGFTAAEVQRRADLLSAVDGNRTMDFCPSVARWTPFNIPAERLSESQWETLKTETGLPDVARREIEDAVGLFRYIQRVYAETPRTRATRKTLTRIADIADALLTEILGNTVNAPEKLSRLTRASAIEIIGFGEPFSMLESRALAALLKFPVEGGNASTSIMEETIQFVHQSCLALVRLRAWASSAVSSPRPLRLTAAEERAKNQLYLVSNLDAILFGYTRKHINRSYKKSELYNYIKTCFMLADPSIGPGSIDDAMRALVKERRRVAKLRV